jgi:hypothetical protein
MLRTYDKVIEMRELSSFAQWKFDSAALNQTAVDDTCGRSNHGLLYPSSPVNLPVSTAPIVIDRQPIVTRNSGINFSPVELEAVVTANPRGLPTLATVSLDGAGTNVGSFQTNLAAVDELQNITVRFGNLVVGPYTQTVTASNAHGIVTTTSAVYKSGWQGNAFRFNPNDYVQTSVTFPQNQFYPTESITVELWFNPTKGGVLASEIGRAVIDLLATGEVKAGFNGVEAILLGQANFNQWNHVAVRYDHVTRNLQGFLNGIPSVVRKGNRITPAESGVQANLAFGQANFVNFGGGEYYGGDIDEIRVWNVARTDEQLTEQRFLLMARGDSGLVLHWQFDHVSVNPVDSSLNGNHGLKRGGPEAVTSTAPLRFAVQPIHRKETQVVLEFLVNPGFNYKFERSNDLATWTAIETNTASGGLLRRAQNFDHSIPGAFFRMTLE